MEIQLNTQEEMVEMAYYFLPDSDSNSMSDFEKYCFSRDLIRTWNSLPIEQIKEKSVQLEVYGFNVKSPQWT